MVDFGYPCFSRESFYRCIWMWCKPSESCVVKLDLIQKVFSFRHTGAIHPRAQNTEGCWLKKKHSKCTLCALKCLLLCFSMNILSIFDRVKLLNVGKDYLQLVFSYLCKNRGEQVSFGYWPSLGSTEWPEQGHNLQHKAQGGNSSFLSTDNTPTLDRRQFRLSAQLAQVRCLAIMKDLLLILFTFPQR